MVADARVRFDSYSVTGPNLSVTVPKRWLLAGIAVWRRHQDLLRNASSLVATTGVTSAMGFAYWAVAARMFSQEAVGYGSAAVSAMTVLGTIGMFGLGTLLIGELPRRHGTRVGLVSAALLASGIGSVVLGLVFAVVAPSVSGRFGHITGTPDRAALFAVGVALTGVTLVFDQATIGLMRGGLQLSRNVAFTAAKLLLLPAAAIALHDGFGVGIAQSWTAGMAVSLGAMAIWLRFTSRPILPRPEWGVLRGLGRTVLAHNWLNLAIGIPSSLIPVLVTLVVSPSAGAAFYIAWTLSAFLYVVPGAPVDSSVRNSVSRPSGDCPKAALHFAGLVFDRPAGHGHFVLGCSPGLEYVRGQLCEHSHIATAAPNNRLPAKHPEGSLYCGMPGGRPNRTCCCGPYNFCGPRGGGRSRGWGMGRPEGRFACNCGSAPR